MVQGFRVEVSGFSVARKPKLAEIGPTYTLSMGSWGCPVPTKRSSTYLMAILKS